MAKRRKDWDPRIKPVKRQKTYDPGPGYDDRLPSVPPFMWIERTEAIGDLGVLAFGAYNAFGLIGPEKGGVAVVFQHPERTVLATKDIPYSPNARDEALVDLVEYMSSLGPLSPAPREALDKLVAHLETFGYDIRG